MKDIFNPDQMVVIIEIGRIILYVSLGFACGWACCDHRRDKIRKRPWKRTNKPE